MMPNDEEEDTDQIHEWAAEENIYIIVSSMYRASPFLQSTLLTKDQLNIR
jgi:hypothetical protein